MLRVAACAAAILLRAGVNGYALPETRADGADTSRHLLLDVPYLAQTEDLCGGASLAMVFRYWGDTSVEPQVFLPLVDRSGHADGGIRTTALRQAAADRGWQATALAPASDPFATTETEIDRGHPLIALIEVRPRIYHYVVIVGLTPAAVVVHDPAAAPYSAITREEFERRWAPTGHWLLLVVPHGPGASPLPGSTATPSAPISHTPPSPTACTSLVDASVSAARAGRTEAAEEGLSAATSFCPDDASGWREMAGLAFVERQYAQASALASRAVRLDASDADAWRLLASARYLTSDTAGALDAWNHARAPIAGDIMVAGTRRTRIPIVIDRSGLVSGRMLTADDVARAARRLADWNLASAVAVRYDPVGAGDTATVHLLVNERPIVPKGLFDLGALGVRTLFRSELATDIVSPARDGDVWTGAYRWAANRPRVGGALTVPSPGWLPGLFTLDGFWEKQS